VAFGFLRRDSGPRRETLRWAAALTLPVFERLPLIDRVRPVRLDALVAARLLCLFATAATSFGCSPQLALDWLSENGLAGELSPREREHIASAAHPEPYAVGCVEAIWVLCWAVSMCDQLRVEDAHAPDDLITKMPSMLQPGAAAAFVGSVRLRQDAELLGKLDQAYYLHWACVDAALHRRPVPLGLDLLRVEWRRRALEWMFASEAWDDVSLDT